MTRLQYYYEFIIRPDLINKCSYRTIQEVPQLEAITLHTTIASSQKGKRELLPAMVAVKQLTGQHPSTTSTKRTDSFRIKRGVPIGCKVTLRQQSMYNFLDSFVSEGIGKSSENRWCSIAQFDKRGNLTHGLHTVAPFRAIEDCLEKLMHVPGIDITIHSSTVHRQDTMLLLSALQVPFKKKGV